MDLSIAIATGIWRLANAMPQKDRRTVQTGQAPAALHAYELAPQVWRGTGIVAIIRALGVHIKNPTVLIWFASVD